MKNIVFFNLAVMPYHVAVFKVLIEKGYRCVVYWYGTAPKTSYRAPEVEGLTLINRFSFKSADSLFEDSKKYNPICVVSSGWVDNVYNNVCLTYRKFNIPTLATSDTQWRGGRQWLNRILSPIRHKRYFDYIWGAGILQYDYARKLGFPSDRILTNCFSGDLDVFSKVDLDSKKADYPKRFLFVGRFVEVKGIDVLLKAWSEINDHKGWTLELIGDGPLKKQFRKEYSDVIIKDFMPQDRLLEEAQNSGCFILPSRFEPWALVIHEFAAAGLPIICTRQCGASRHFVLNEYNGYTIDADDISGLKKAIMNIIDMDTDELIKMSHNSQILSQTATPTTVADTLISVLKQSR